MSCILTVATSVAKDRDWQVGRVLDSAMSRTVYDTGTVTRTSGTATAYGSATANTTGSATTIGNATTLHSSTDTSGMATARTESVSSTAIQRVAVQTNELYIVTHKYLYVIEDTRRYGTGGLLVNALANRKHGCRFVVGEDIKYVQEKGYLWVLDPDGKECKISIVRQQVLEKDAFVPAGAPSPAPAMEVPAGAGPSTRVVPPPGAPQLAAAAASLPLQDATPIHLRLTRALTSVAAKVGDTVNLETIEELKVDGVLVIDRGATAVGTVTEAEEKKLLVHSGRPGINLDYVRLVDGDRVPLRATKEGQGGVQKNVTFPRGTEITAYVDGDIILARDRFVNGAVLLPVAVAQSLPVRAAPAPSAAAPPPQAAAPAPSPRAATLLPGGLVEMAFTSNPPGAKVSMYGTPIGRTPFTAKLQPGTYKVIFSASGFPDLTENVSVGPRQLSSVAHAAFAIPSTQ